MTRSGTVASFLGFTAPKPATWIWQPPETQQRAAQYAVPGQNGADQAHIAVFHFPSGQGGSVEDNMKRWQSQFQSSNGEPVEPKVEEFQADGLPITLVELAGEWKGAGAGWYTPDQLFLGAIVESPIGNIFIRLVGPTATVEANREAFLNMLKGLRQTKPEK